MQKRINGKLCDTEKATIIGNKAVGEYGDQTGYEEILYINKMKQYFLYGNGGLESIYTKPTMLLFTDEQAEVWKNENGIKTSKSKAAKPADKAAKTKEVKNPAVNKGKTAPKKENKIKAKKASDDSKK